MTSEASVDRPRRPGERYTMYVQNDRPAGDDGEIAAGGRDSPDSGSYVPFMTIQAPPQARIPLPLHTRSSTVLCGIVSHPLDLAKDLIELGSADSGPFCCQFLVSSRLFEKSTEVQRPCPVVHRTPSVRSGIERNP